MQQFRLQGMRIGAKLAFLKSIGVLICALFLSGCGKGGGGSGALQSGEAEHIGKVNQFIVEYKKAHSGNDPKNIEEVKDWAIKEGKAEEKDFISTRDKKLYVLEAMSPPGGPPGMRMKMPMILHEAEGVKGNKYVV